MKKLIPLSLLAAGAVSFVVAVPAHAQPLFSESFDTDTSGSWTALNAAQDNVADFSAVFAYDYSLKNIPPAPGTLDGSTKGLKLTVNKNDAVQSRSGVNLYPTGENFSGDYYVSFDMWANVKGVAGTTEYVLFGINHTGASMNWNDASADGVWFAATTEGGSGVAGADYRAYEGATRLAEGSTGYNIATEVSSTTSPTSRVAQIFPQPKWTYLGSPANHWVRVRIVQYQGKVSLYFNDNLVLQRDRTGAPSFNSGNLMLGYMDTFTGGAADQPDDVFVVYDNVRAGRIVTVNTANNNSTGGDGQTSLQEALTGVQEGDEIRFNLAGAGPHYLETPAAGYPEITVNHVFVNGYSQPGSVPNSSPILGTNNAQIKIVLDSRNGGRRVVDYPGFGTGESGIMAVVHADQVRFEGLGFLSVKGSGDEGDAAIYGVALVGDSDRTQVSGCWFGLDPADGTTVATMNDGIAGFRFNPSGLPVQFPDQTIVGTTGDGPDAVQQFNIFIGMTIPVILEGSGYRISGNFFNVFPNGVSDYNHGLVGAGDFEGHIEFGRNGSSVTIGTDGDGQSDANERNIFGGVIPSAYDTAIEFYGGGSPQTNIVIAGNYFGVGIDGQTQFTNSSYLVSSLQPTATVRIGSDFDGLSDDLEGNLIFNNRPLEFHFPDPTTSMPNELLNANPGAQVSLRGNWLKGNLVPPVSPINFRHLDYFGAFIQDTNNGVRPVLLTNSTTTRLEGTVPIAKEAYPNTIIDVYLPDPTSLEEGILFAFPEFPNGFVQSRTHLATYVEDSLHDEDSTLGTFVFDISALQLAPGTKVIVTATYSQDAVGDPDARGHTTVASEYVELVGAAEPLHIMSSTIADGQITITWMGGTPPYQLQRRASLTEGTWENVGAAGSTTTAIQPVAAGNAFFRVQGQ